MFNKQLLTMQVLFIKAEKLSFKALELDLMNH